MLLSSNKQWYNPTVTIFNTEVVFHWTWFFMLVTSLISNTFVTIWLPITCIVILHEFGHIFGARFCGVPTYQIVMTPIGGMAHTSISDKPLHEFIIIAAGPLVNVLLVPILWYLDSSGHVFNINLSLLIFNLLPIYPLDGGSLFRTLLHVILKSPYRATWWAGRIGQVLAVAGLIYGFATGNFMICLIMAFLIYSAEEAIRMYAIFNAITALRKELDTYRQVSDFSKRIY